MKSALRESIDSLIEYMAGGSYPGPEPGKLFSISTAYPGHPAARMQRDQEQEKEAKKLNKKKKADFRPQLRKLSLWLQQKGGR